jgi:FkbM family methyltransferase
MDSDLETYRQVFIERQFDLTDSPQRDRLQQYYQQQLDLGKLPVIIDAGANVGAAAHWFSHQFPKSAVFAIEPDSDNAQLCRKNVARLANVTVVEGAIGGRHGSVSVRRVGKSWGSQTIRVESGPGVTVYTVADIMRMAGPAGSLLIVKADIEGFEADLFEHGTEWVADVASIFIEVHDWLLPGQKTSQSLQKAVLGQGFEIVVRHENLIFVRESLAQTSTPSSLS